MVLSYVMFDNVERMNKAMLTTIIGGALIVILTSLFAFTPNSANPSSTPALKSYALSVINNERSKSHLQPLRQGAAISADNQARFLLTQPTLTHLDSSGNTPSKRYSKNGETGYVAENLSVYHCSDVDACKTANTRWRRLHERKGVYCSTRRKSPYDSFTNGR